MSLYSNICFYGGGAWGQALAISLASIGYSSTLIVSDKNREQEINNHISKKFPEIRLSPLISASVKNREKLSNKNAEILALSIIKNLGLEPKILNLYPSEISGGMQKRIAIARAICGNPKILLFDEPTSGLDPVTGSLIDKLIIKAVKTVGGSAITITHDMSSVCRIADKVILIDNQTIGWSGTPKQMLKSKNSKIQEFIKSTNPNLFK